MGALLAAGIGLSAIGGITSAFGASSNAKKARKQAKYNADLEKKFAQSWTQKTNEFIDKKEEKLNDVGNIFDRFASTGAFGDTNTLDNLRKAQSDFSALAAGDFSGFESALRKTLSDQLISTFGSGSPIGTFANLAADTQLQFRQTGLQEALKTTDFLSNESNKLLALEFGLMDQEYDTLFKLDRNRLTAVTGLMTQAASQAGLGYAAAGSAMTGIGSNLASFGLYMNNQRTPVSNNPNYDTTGGILRRTSDVLNSPFATAMAQIATVNRDYSIPPVTGGPVQSVTPPGYSPRYTPSNMNEPNLPNDNYGVVSDPIISKPGVTPRTSWEILTSTGNMISLR